MMEKGLEVTSSKTTNGTVLIESLVEGDDYIGVYVVCNRKIVFQCMLAEESRLNSDGSMTAIGLAGPIDLPHSIANQAQNMIVDLINKYDIINAPVSFSVRVCDERIVPIELHLDFGGELAFDWLISSILPEGINDILAGLLDEKLLIPTETDKANAIVYDTSADIQKIAKDYKMTVKQSHKITKASGRKELALNFIRTIKNIG
jgi:hypothetical protein